MITPTIALLSPEPRPAASHLAIFLGGFFPVLGFFYTVDALIEDQPGAEPEVIIIYLTKSPDANQAILRQLRGNFPHSSLLVLTPSVVFPELVSFVEKGISACLQADTSLPEIFQAVRAVLAGGAYFGPVFNRQLAERLRTG